MGPLKGYRVIEIAGIGPGPFACMMLADMGADVIRLERATGARGVDAIPGNIGNRSRRSVGVDLKNPDAVELILRLVEQADALVEGFRAGVAERLGIGPDVCLGRNPRLVYGRMTGWGQSGPYASMAGHDINYIALAGALAHFGRPGETPVPPINMVGDFGGGGMLMAFGVVCGLLEAKESGQGQVVDAAMVDGSATLMAMIYGLRAMGLWSLEKGTNIIDGGAHFYDAYETADGKYVSVGSIEPQFYAELLRLTGLEGEDLPHQMDRSQWPALKERMAGIFRQRTRDEWCELLEGTDVCFAPVLTMEEAPAHPHNVARGTFVEIDGVVQPAPAPRFSRTPGEISRPPSAPAADTDEALADWGLSEAEIAKLRSAGAIA
ncbi:MAG TPA: CaiB/BaiF CoA-transferase family protein [Acidimicrobiia bacterium]|jgi:alpha-methylacyl-CoA racemase|nr:CaiB/BaiF CoA-transferase family protein [Acidimicrobiia bacterium]